MPIVVNGTTIPENVANVLNVNGTNITSVVCDGVPVWAQNLFSALWSGSSMVNPAGITTGIETSGSDYRFKRSSYAAFKKANSDGTFSGNSTYSVFGGSEAIVVSSNLIGVISGTNRTGWVTFDLATKAFSGNSYAYTVGDGDTISLQTAGGLLRYSYTWSSYNGITYNGPYISLT